MKYFLMWYVVVILFLFLINYIANTAKTCDSSDVIKCRHGRASKIEYCDHTYIVWQQNLSDCIIHDPDCKCYEKK